jgi:MerR family transcriptional regulator, light-induced transcriptional regulator
MFETYSTDPVFNVKAIVHQTGVAAATLRAWERRYGIPTPPRTDSGYRLYSARDVAMIRWLKSQLETGMSISQAANLLRMRMEMPDAELPPLPPTFTSPLPASYQRLHDDIINAGSSYDEDGVERAFNEAFSLFSVEDVCLNIISPVLVSVGERWHAGDMTISAEHFITNLVRRKLLTLLSATPAPIHDKKIVSACAPDEFHEIGLLIVSIFLRRHGYPVVYLGQNISGKRLNEMLDKTQPHVLLLSATQLRSAANLIGLFEDVKRTSGRYPNLTVLAYGGRVFSRLPSLRDRIPGVWVGESARECVHRIEQLLSSPRDVSSGIQHTLERPEARDLLDALRERRADIVGLTSKLISGAPIELNSVAHKYERALETAERLFQVLDSAVRLDEPASMGVLDTWDWDSLTPDGLSLEQIRTCAIQLSTAAFQILPEPFHATLRPFLVELQNAVAVVQPEL